MWVTSEGEQEPDTTAAPGSAETLERRWSSSQHAVQWSTGGSGAGALRGGGGV